MNFQGKDQIRIAVVQYAMQRIASFEAFAEKVTYFAEVAADAKVDFLVFPEFFTLQLLSIGPRLAASDAVVALSEHSPRLDELFRRLAMEGKVNILAGTRLRLGLDGQAENVAHFYLRDGGVAVQPKLHPTPCESSVWRVEGRDRLLVVPTDCGPVGVLICYDVEFPELARHLADQGANILLVPFCTDDRAGYLRVRYCAQARAVENQLYVALAGNVGHLPGVENMDIQYAESAILTPSDRMFPPDGVAGAATPNVEMIVMADVRLADLDLARRQGAVRNLADRRPDLYRIDWGRKP
jgi:predicted amidohydrolase